MHQDNNFQASNRINSITHASCPFLGTVDDSTTWLDFPHPGNYCYRIEPAIPLNTEYQQSTCLKPSFQDCIIYKEDWKEPLPDGIRGMEIINGPRRLFFPWGISIIVLSILILAIILVVIPGLRPSSGIMLTQPPATSSLPSQTSTLQGLLNTTQSPALNTTQTSIPPSEVDTLSATPTTHPSATPSPSTTSSPTSASPTEGPGVRTPFGPQGKYLLHLVQTGESMSSIASLYDTNTDVIIASNTLIEGASIWPGAMLVILPGQKDPSNAIKFRVIQLDQETQIQDLAQLYKVTSEDIREYNSLGSGEAIPAGRWLIIPVVD